MNYHRPGKKKWKYVSGEVLRPTDVKAQSEMEGNKLSGNENHHVMFK